MLSELQQLKKLVFDGGYDDESRRHVQELEDRLTTLAQTHKLAETPGVKEWVDYLVGEVRRCELLLKTDETLTDLQRGFLFTTIKVASKYTRQFTGEDLRNLEDTIKRELDAARHS